MNFKNIKNTVLTNVTLSAISALTSIAIARLYGASIRGDYASLMALINMLVATCVFGTPTFLANFISTNEFDKVNDNMRLSILNVVIVSGGFSTLFFYLISGYFIDAELNSNYIILILCYLPISIFSVLLLNISLGQQNWKSFNLGKLAYGLINFLFVFFFYFIFGSDLSNLVWAIFIANIISLSLQLQFSKGLFKGSNLIKLGVLKVYFKSKHYALNSLVNIANGQADVLIFALLSSSVNVGYWAVARTMSSIISPVNQALSNWIFSLYSNNTLANSHSFAAISRIFIAINLIFGTIIIVISKFAVPIIFGKEFIPSIVLVPFAIFGAMSGAYSEMIEEKFRGSRNAKPVTKIRLIPLVTFGVLILFFQKMVTVNEIALFYLIGQVLRATYALYFSSKEDKIPLNQYLLLKKSDVLKIKKNIIH